MSDSVFGNEKTGSIRDIPLPGDIPVPAKKTRKSTAPIDEIKDWNNMKQRNKRRGPKILAGLIILLIFFFLIASLFHKATITITPKKEAAPISQTFNATNTGEEGSMAFSRVSSFSGTESLFLKGSIEENVQTKASGKITVSNKSETQQRFIPNTRFETTKGLVYRTPRSVVIPAQGETEITVVADIPGDEYNIPSGATFTLPGLVGADSFSSFSAKQTGEITGGYSGVITAATKDEIKAGKNTLEKNLQDSLQKELLAKVPAGFVVTNDLLYISPVSFAEKPNETKGGIDLVAEATIEAVMFKKTDFDTFVASSVLKDYTPGQSVSITNVPQITMRIVSDNFDIQEDDSFEFSLRSPKEGAQFLWNLDEQAVINSVAGKEISFVENGLVGELSVAEKVSVGVSPFWKSKIPKNVKKIELIINK